ncbi:hypothetical protein [Saccharibacter sp. 17.LH.SD]|uniref:hypothetical protein n=1 Tax=Saccharibacter sp. 17.LH.SD TaxID=2689393 RepID=UPI001928566C|nr:hypothetical protein [Saccharibacter sp. 17.LH.SD]
MKKVAVLMLCLAASGCSGLGKHIGDTSWIFGGDPNMPHGDSETFRRVRGEAVTETPLMAQKDDIWPGQPDAVPTIQDVNNPNSHFSHLFRNSLGDLNEDLDEQLLANGEALSMGESVETRHGVQRRSTAIGPALPSHVTDHAPNYLEGPNRDTVAIPNGDGTTTLVAPNGSVRVVRGDPSLIAKHNKLATASRKRRAKRAYRQVTPEENMPEEATKTEIARPHKHRHHHHRVKQESPLEEKPVTETEGVSPHHKHHHHRHHRIKHRDHSSDGDLYYRETTL